MRLQLPIQLKSPQSGVMPERCCCSLIETTPGVSLPEVLPLLMPLAYRKPRPPLKRFSNLSYLQRVHARNCLAARTPLASRRPVISTSPGHTITVAAAPRSHCSSNGAANLAIVSHFCKNRPPAHALAPVESPQPADSLAETSSNAELRFPFLLLIV